MRIVTSNADFVRGHNGDLLRHLAKIAGPRGVVCLQEVKDVIVRDFLTTDHVVQDTTDPARAGTALVGVRIRLRRAGIWLLGRSAVTLPRYVRRARAGRIVILSVHIAPPRAGDDVQDDQLDRIMAACRRLDRRRKPWVIGLDSNVSPRELAAAAKRAGVHADLHMEGIVGLMTSRRVEVNAWGVDRTPRRKGWSDHPAVWADVEVAA